LCHYNADFEPADFALILITKLSAVSINYVTFNIKICGIGILFSAVACLLPRECEKTFNSKALAENNCYVEDDGARLAVAYDNTNHNLELI